MKKIFLLIMIMVCASSLYALELTLAPGLLPEKMGMVEKSNDKNLVLKGEATSVDLISLHRLPLSVETLDMSDLKILGGSIADGEWFGQKTFTDGEIPAYMLLATGVKNVKFPSGPVVLGRGAFSSTPISSVKISNLRKLGEGAFRNCDKLTTVDFTESNFDEIPSEAFSGCSRLSDVGLSGSITKVGDYAFAKSGVKTIRIPHVKSIGEYAFSFCQELEDITFSSSCKIGEGCFLGAGYIENLQGKPADIPPLYAAFSNLSDTTFIHSEVIREGAFSGSLVSSVGFGKEVRKIEPYAFHSMPALKRVVVTDCDNIPEADASAFEGNDVSKIYLHVRRGDEDRWRSAPVWQDFNIATEESVVEQVPVDNGGIGIRNRNGVIAVTAPGGLKRVEIFSLEGMKLLSASPEKESVDFDYPDGYEVVVVRAEGEGTIKIIKLTK